MSQHALYWIAALTIAILLIVIAVGVEDWWRQRKGR